MSIQDLSLLQDARLLLRTALQDSDVLYTPHIESKIRKTLLEIENSIDKDEILVITAFRNLPVRLDAVRYAMQLMWFYSNVSRHPDLAAQFDDSLRMVEARMLDIEAPE
ncbi:hypothetical protein [Pararhodobacter sp.]|jgi:hypothetical protein|uniref:hypothetical protein n=1 Tax=Pararhodobacter sp. TaxID=2127056 RepID=UPI002FDD696C